MEAHRHTTAAITTALHPQGRPNVSDWKSVRLAQDRAWSLFESCIKGFVSLDKKAIDDNFVEEFKRDSKELRDTILNEKAKATNKEEKPAATPVTEFVSEAVGRSAQVGGGSLTIHQDLYLTMSSFYNYFTSKDKPSKCKSFSFSITEDAESDVEFARSEMINSLLEEKYDISVPTSLRTKKNFNEYRDLAVWKLFRKVFSQLKIQMLDCKIDIETEQVHIALCGQEDAKHIDAIKRTLSEGMKDLEILSPLKKLSSFLDDVPLSSIIAIPLKYRAALIDFLELANKKQLNAAASAPVPMTQQAPGQQPLTPAGGP